MDPFLGEIKLVAFNYPPHGWAFCDGQLMSIAQNTALFSLLGTFYGGNGIQTFALPDLRGRAIVSQGQGPGLSPYVVGEILGNESVTLLDPNMPAHTHPLRVKAGLATTAVPTGNELAQAPLALGNVYSPTPNAIAPNRLTQTGGNQHHDNMQPYLVLRYVIALAGIFPSRN